MSEQDGIQELGPEQAQEMLKHRPEFQLLDVRERWEFQRQHIPGARLIPLGEVAQRLDELDPALPVLCICARGHRSYKAARLLVSEGFAEVVNLTGGTQGWVAQRLPTQ